MISIATVSEKDVARLQTLAGRTFQESHGQSAPGHDIHAYLERSFNQSILEAELKNRKNLYFFVHSSDETAGCSKLLLNCSCPQVPNDKGCKLERLYLLEEYHNHILYLEY